MPRRFTEHVTYECVKKHSPKIDSNNNPITERLSRRYPLDEYNPYRYGLVPLSEKTIYRSFEVLSPEQVDSYRRGFPQSKSMKPDSGKKKLYKETSRIETEMSKNAFRETEINEKQFNLIDRDQKLTDGVPARKTENIIHVAASGIPKERKTSRGARPEVERIVPLVVEDEHQPPVVDTVTKLSEFADYSGSKSPERKTSKLAESKPSKKNHPDHLEQPKIPKLRYANLFDPRSTNEQPEQIHEVLEQKSSKRLERYRDLDQRSPKPEQRFSKEPESYAEYLERKASKSKLARTEPKKAVVRTLDANVPYVDESAVDKSEAVPLPSGSSKPYRDTNLDDLRSQFFEPQAPATKVEVQKSEPESPKRVVTTSLDKSNEKISFEKTRAHLESQGVTHKPPVYPKFPPPPPVESSPVVRSEKTIPVNQSESTKPKSTTRASDRQPRRAKSIERIIPIDFDSGRSWSQEEPESEILRREPSPSTFRSYKCTKYVLNVLESSNT